MSNILFDCTQIISFNLKRNIDTKKLFSRFEKLNFKTLVDGAIESKKINYLRDYLSTCNIELINDEFVGEFEDWKNVDEIPEWIGDFIDTFNTIVNNDCIDNLKLIMIEYAPENTSENNICDIRINGDNFKNGLFAFSKSNFDYWGNIMIFSTGDKNEPE